MTTTTVSYFQRCKMHQLNIKRLSLIRGVYYMNYAVVILFIPCRVKHMFDVNSLHKLFITIRRELEREKKRICLLIVACEFGMPIPWSEQDDEYHCTFVYRYCEITFQYQPNNNKIQWWYWEQSIHLYTKSNMQNECEQVQNVHKSIESNCIASFRLLRSFTHSFIRSFVSRSVVALVHHITPMCLWKC